MKTFVVLLFLFISSCATPVAPTGGEPDRSGPRLIATQPIDATVNYRERVIRFTFDDYVDRNSFRQSLRIEPNISVPYEISWRRKTATINLLEPLPTNTTVVFNIGTELRDTRGNRLSSPITLGLSTGPDIDKGEATINLIPLRPGINTANVRVLLYREPADFAKPALYLAEPDTSGTASFSYLAEGKYSVIAVHDVNRNRTWDPPREYAQPASLEYFSLESGLLDMGTIYYDRTDTTRTILEGVGLLSANRLRLRFSRPLQYSANSRILINNLETNESYEAGLLFLDSSDETVAFFHSSTSLDEATQYSIDLSGYSDRNGRRKINNLEPFSGSSEQDTTFIRFKRHLTQDGIRGKEPIKLMYTGILDGTGLADSLQIFLNRTMNSNSVRVETSYNLLSIYPVERWNEADAYEIRAWDPAQQRHIDISTRFIKEADLGEIQISLIDSSYIEIPLFLEVYNSSGESLVKERFRNTFSLENLPNGNYHVIVFVDAQENAEWFSGRISPFEAPAPIYVNRRVPVRSRMTSEVEVRFNGTQYRD
jgi:hypothetical protein